MKRIFTLLMLFVSLTISAQTYMPDDAFEAWCEDITLGNCGDGIANNNTIDSVAASYAVNISLDNIGISDLTGLEAFSALTHLNVANNNLSNIDISFLGNNLIVFNALNNNSDLYCINVFDTAYAVSQPLAWTVDTFTSFSTDCATAFGCMDALACNYIASASIDTVAGGACFYNIDTIWNAVNVCDTFIWDFNGGIYTTSGLYYDTLTTVDGCDSVGEIDITIRYSTESHTYDSTICDVTVWNNLIVDLTGSYFFYMPGANAVGCDSTAWLHAVVNYSATTTDTQLHCDSYTWIDGNTYTVSNNTAQHMEQTVGGCDSLITLDLTIDNSHTYTDAQVHCYSYTWINGTTYTVSNNTDSFMYHTVVGGCDSLILLNLIITDSTFATTIITECDSYTWPAPLGDGNTYTASGTHTHSTTNSNGCVHVQTLALTINNSNTGSSSVTACNSYSWDGVAYTTSGAYNNTYTNAAGCDSVHTLNLTINSSSVGDATITACDLYTDILGNEYDTSGTYTFIIYNGNALACDSTVTLYLTIDYLDSSFASADVCDSYTWNGTTYTTSGVYNYNTTTVLGGCDSTAQLDLTIRNSSNNPTQFVNACDIYVWYDANGDTLFTPLNSGPLSGNYAGAYDLTSPSGAHYIDSVVYSNVAGCDSTVYLDLLLNQSYVPSNITSIISIYACGGWTNPYDGSYYDESQTVAVAIASTSAGCDSMAWFDINIAPEKQWDTTVVACDSFTWAETGGTYTSSGTITNVYSVFHSFGQDSTILCDSTVYLYLTINPSTTSSSTVTTCNSYNWNGTSYTSSGTYTYSTSNSNGCDSTATLDLTIDNSHTYTDTQVHCDSYTWIDGINYTSSNNTASYTYGTVVGGCDSTIYLNLTINNSYSITLPSVISCNSYHWGMGNGGLGVTIITSGLYTSYFQTSNGCDSLLLLYVTIDSPDTYTDVITACDSYTWVNGLTYSSSNNTDSIVYSTALGVCDSTIYLDLTINSSNVGSSTELECDSFLWVGSAADNIADSVYTVSGIYTNTYTNVAGCDSVHTLNLTINYSNTGTSSATACESYTWNGFTTYTGGSYTQTFTNVAGCDSVHTLNLTIDNTVITHDYVTACYAYEWSPWSYPTNIYGFDTTSIFNVNINSLVYIVIGNNINSSVCTDTAYLHLTINPLEYGSGTAVACDSYLWEGNSYNTTGIYIDTIQGTYCDSIVTLDLTVNYSSMILEIDTVCDMYAWLDGNGDTIDTYTTSGTYTDIHTNLAGCDSVVTLNLVIKNSSLTVLSSTACDSLRAAFWGTNGWDTLTFFADTVYTYPHPAGNAVGCDSLITHTITINNSWPNVTHSITACDSYDFGGVTYTNDTLVTETLTTFNGCDSIVTLELIVNYSSTGSSITDSVCDSYIWNGVVYDSSGVYTNTYTNAAGCDSTATLNLTIFGLSTSETITRSSCDSYIWGTDTIMTSGVYTNTYTNVAGCDSTVILDLTINESPTILALIHLGAYLNASVTGGIAPYTYEWTDPNGVNSTDASIEPLESGLYCVEVTDNVGCASNEVCEEIYISSISDLNVSEFNIYPNPTSSYIYLEFTATKIADYTIKVMSYNGAEVYRDELRKFNGEFSTTIDLSTFSKGTYLVEVSYENHIIYRKILLQ